MHLKSILLFASFLRSDRSEKSLDHFLGLECPVTTTVLRRKHLDLIAGLRDESGHDKLIHIHPHGVPQKLGLVEAELGGAEHVPAKKSEPPLGFNTFKPARC